MSSECCRYILQVLIPLLIQALPCTDVDCHIYLRFCITSWSFPDTSMFIKSTVTWWLVNPNLNRVFIQLFGLQQLLNNNTLLFKWVDLKYCFQKFDNDLDLSYDASWALSLSIWKHRYYFPGGISVENCGIVVVVIVSPKEEEQQLFFWGVSFDFESSLYLPFVLLWWLVLWYHTDDSTLFAPI